ncbi:MAG: uroporphyrinogen-III C-methyltransferase [Tindallia sp. MSAO_Bac2]|nr:MAG: uroporphyrinogen-III C-methyltransferase [Tindallia sp. MSAO_Bac2]
MKNPMVYLVGAGPGAEDLITIKGMNCLKKAEVVMYDRLSGAELLAYAPEGAEMINVGKKPDHHPVPQEEINRILVEKAKEGKIVVRLKGGDPFVFGRGGEEALALAEENLPFEIVPGITSAIAVPAYAGIPVTHRHISPSFHVITGHEDPTQEESLDYEVLAKLSGTLVFLMGVGQLEIIVDQLTKYGKNPETPAALIHRGTTSQQKTVAGTLRNIVKRVRDEDLKPPCIIVIGDVVALQPVLQWVEKKPLFGKRIMVTRSREQASRLTENLKNQGAVVLEFPTIEIKPIENPKNMEHILRNLENYQHIIFTSTNGVDTFMKQLQKNGMDLRCLSKDCRITAVGSSTQGRLEKAGIRVDYLPEVFTAEGILETLKPLVQEGEKVLLPRAGLGRKNLIQGLEAMGAEVEELVLYETKVPMANRDHLVKILSGKIDWITFTSGSTVNNFAEIIGEENLHLVQNSNIAVIGPVTAAAAYERGLPVTCQADPHTINALVEAIRKESKVKDES